MLINQSIIGKAIAIILVVFGHLGFIPNGGAIGVSIFLVLSGYGIAKSSEKNEFQFEEYWKKRIINVYIPFLLCSACWVLILNLINSPIIKVNSQKISIVLGMIGFPNNPYDPTMWYISFIFMMYASFWCSFKFFERRIFKVLACLILCMIVGWGSIYIYSNSIGIYLYLFSFPIGVIIALYDNILTFLCKWLSSYKLIVFMAVLFFLEYMSGRNVIYYELLTVYSSFLIIPILTQLTHFEKKFIIAIGKSSYAIYLVEGVIMRLMWEILGRDKLICNFLCGVAILNIGIFIHHIWSNTKVSFRKMFHLNENVDGG